jgi:hypothetical protein
MKRVVRQMLHAGRAAATAVTRGTIKASNVSGDVASGLTATIARQAKVISNYAHQQVQQSQRLRQDARRLHRSFTKYEKDVLVLSAKSHVQATGEDVKKTREKLGNLLRIITNADFSTGIRNVDKYVREVIEAINRNKAKTAQALELIEKIEGQVRVARNYITANELAFGHRKDDKTSPDAHAAVVTWLSMEDRIDYTLLQRLDRVEEALAALKRENNPNVIKRQIEKLREFWNGFLDDYNHLLHKLKEELKRPIGPSGSKIEHKITNDLDMGFTIYYDTWDALFHLVENQVAIATHLHLMFPDNHDLHEEFRKNVHPLTQRMYQRILKFEEETNRA